MNRILEIGPGTHPIDGADTLDCTGHPTYLAKWGERLPIPDATYHEIFASHVLEHVPWFRTVDALREARRVLVTGGHLELWVPNFAYIVIQYVNETCGDDWRKHNDKGDFMQWVNGRIFTYGPDPNWHRAVFDAPHLKRSLLTAGFKNPTQLKVRTRGASHGPVELGMVAIK